LRVGFKEANKVFRLRYDDYTYLSLDLNIDSMMHKFPHSIKPARGCGTEFYERLFPLRFEIYTDDEAIKNAGWQKCVSLYMSTHTKEPTVSKF